MHTHACSYGEVATVQLGAGKADKPVALFAMNSSPTNTLPLHQHFSIVYKDGTGK